MFAVADNMPVLIAGCVIQGLGAGGLDVLSEVFLIDLTTLRDSPLNLGRFALPMTGGGICGAIIGAALSEFISWRWVDWINLPVISACGCAGFLLPSPKTYWSLLPIRHTPLRLDRHACFI